MIRPWKIGNAFGIDIFVHWTFLFLPLWIVLNQPAAPAGELLFVMVLVAAMFGCVVLHELGHALTARGFGIGTRDITLYPIGGVARLERMSENPWEEIRIAVAGPAVNVVIALVLGLVLFLGALVSPGWVSASSLGHFVFLLMALNLGMVVFNLLPAFPMDGGRVLRAFLSLAVGHLQGTRAAVWVGGVLALMLGLGGALILGNPWLLVIAAFIFLAGQQELRMVEMREHLRWSESERPNRGYSSSDASSDAFPSTEAPFDLQPKVSVYVWDKETGLWVKQRSGSFNRVP